MARFVLRHRVMSKSIPSVQKYMTASPHSVGVDQTLAMAHEVMRARGIRHLPVLDGGKLVGVVSDRDLHMIESLSGVDVHKVTVAEAMSTSVYAVEPETALDAVASTMAAHKYGCAVVIQNQKVVGIFTTVDLCHTLVALLQTRLTH